MDGWTDGRTDGWLNLLQIGLVTPKRPSLRDFGPIQQASGAWILCAVAVAVSARLGACPTRSKILAEQRAIPILHAPLVISSALVGRNKRKP